MLTRRQLMLAAVLGAAAGPAVSLRPRTAHANPGRPRLAVILLRGGMDGLFAVPPYADKALAAARGSFAIAGPGGGPGAAIDLDGFYGLHPVLGPLKPHWDAGRLAIVHAVGQGGRPRRSHFEAQLILETGMDEGRHDAVSGWLNRGWEAVGGDSPILTMTPAIPPIVRGTAPVFAHSGSNLPHISQEAYERVRALYSGDPAFRKALSRAEQMREMTEGMAAEDGPAPRSQFAAEARLAGTLLAAPDGPSIAFLQSGGWDTHNRQGNANTGKLPERLGELAEGLQALLDGLGPALARTVVLVTSEFGRTILENGTNGTDHGWGGAMFVLGGPVRGGRVIADWPGLSARATFAKKLLEATTEQRSLYMAILREHLKLPQSVLVEQVFPGSARVPVMEGLIREDA